MTPADLDRVIEIERNLKQAPHWPHSAWISVLDPLSSPPRIALVAEDSSTGKVSAFAVASLLPSQAELEMIAVASEAQRQGVARLLFAALAKELKTRQVTEVCLEVRTSNRPALALYRSLGFAETARRPRYYADPVEDAVLLSLRLP
jgi:[ribosomal protein S18]-alanine N-acetyltransferase